VARVGTTGAQEPGGPAYRRIIVSYDLPDVTLINQDGARVPLTRVLNADKPVLLNFLFATCTTVCPLLSSGVSTLLKRLGDEAGAVRVVSIAIDPDHDTPEVLRRYRERYGVGSEWELLTGTREDIARVQKAFDAYSPDKIAHRPLNFLRPAGGARWVRIDGVIGASDLKGEHHSMRRPWGRDPSPRR
jgi:protein SCO1/2